MVFKKLILLFVFSFPIFNLLSAQNGLTGIPLPTGYPFNLIRQQSCVQADKQGNLWLGFGNLGAGIGLGKFNGQSWTIYNTGNSPLPNNGINCLLADGDLIWVGTAGGLVKIDASGNFTVYKGISAFPNDRIKALKKHGGVLWIGTETGLSRLEGNVFTIINSGFLSGIRVNALETETNGDLWIGTNKGLVKYNDKILQQLDTSNSPLQNNEVLALRRDKNNLMWVGTKAKPGFFISSGLHYIKENILLAASAFLCHSQAAEDISTFAQDAEGNVYCRGMTYLGTNDYHLLYRLEERNNDQFFIRGPGSIVSDYIRLHNGTNGQIAILNFMRSDSFFLFNPSQYKNVFYSKPDRKKALDINKVSSLLPDILSDLQGVTVNLNSKKAYRVPKDGCNSVLFTKGLWIGGLDMVNKLHCAALRYKEAGNDFFSGTLDTTDGSYDVTGNNQLDLDYTWEIRKTDIEAFKEAWTQGEIQNGTYTIPHDILTWPAHGKGNSARYLAPFVDIDSDGNYDPNSGDYPLIKGDEMIYWIMNDNKEPHGESGGEAFGVEIHHSAWAYGCMDIKDNDSNAAVNYTTFYESRIINRSNDDYKDLFVGTFTDVDLGYYGDDFVGCNPTGNYAYGYNGDNNDEGGYGENPPMVNVLYLNQKMDKFIYFNNDWSVIGNPQTAEEYYSYLQGKFRDGSPLSYGGSGHLSGAPTNWHFPGNPWGSGWTEKDAHIPGDRRFVMSTGPLYLKAKEVISLQYAIIYSRDAANPNGLNTSWAKNEQYIRRIKEWYANDTFPSCPDKSAGIFNENKSKPQLKVYPNPGTNRLYIEMAGATELEAEVYDGLGRKVLVTKLRSAEGTFDFDISHLPHGAYILRTKASGEVAGTVFIKQE